MALYEPIWSLWKADRYAGDNFPALESAVALLGGSPGAHITDGATNAANNNATNYNIVSGLLGVANGLNAGNANQNDLADKYNALATKFNTLLDRLEARGILATV